MKRQIRSATGPYGNNVNVNMEQMQILRNALKTAYNTLEEMDDDTFNACDGEGIIDDIDTALREVDSAIKFVKGLN